MDGSVDNICIPAKCEKTAKDFFVMGYKAYDGTWIYAYGIESVTAPFSRNNDAVTVKLERARSGLQFSCPHCGQRHSFTCPHCGKNTCFDGDTHDGRTVICGHCGGIGIYKNNSKSIIDLSGKVGAGQ